MDQAQIRCDGPSDLCNHKASLREVKRTAVTELGLK